MQWRKADVQNLEGLLKKGGREGNSLDWGSWVRITEQRKQGRLVLCSIKLLSIFWRWIYALHIHTYTYISILYICICMYIHIYTHTCTYSWVCISCIKSGDTNKSIFLTRGCFFLFPKAISPGAAQLLLLTKTGSLMCQKGEIQELGQSWTAKVLSLQGSTLEVFVFLRFCFMQA